MAHDVFISYSSTDKKAADTICSELERRGIQCWIAPRDIVPGMPWAESIVDALEASKVMVLVFTARANTSVQIHREVERAVHKDVPIIPIRLEDVVPTRTMEYFISATHWFDAIEPPLDTHLDRFSRGVSALLGRRKRGLGDPASAIPAPDLASIVERPVAAAPPPVAPPPPAAAPPPEADTGVPSSLGNYDVGAFLGMGRYGSVVHAGTHKLLGNPVALRIFRPPAKDRGSAVRERFLREARALQVPHPNIIHVKDFGEAGDVLYVVTDLLAGCSLGELLAADGPLPWPKLHTFCKELVDATSAVHAQNGLVSGLRPDMIRVVREGTSERLAISSAGVNAAQELLSVMNEAALRGQAAAGEMAYIAPELLMGKTADVRSDIFTIGVLAYQMAAGKPPFQAATYPELLGAMLTSAPPDLVSLRPDVPAPAAAIVMQCLASNPQQRFGTASEVLEAWLKAT